MQYDPELADPLVDVRDVVESFRSFGVTPKGWRRTLTHAAKALDQLPTELKLKVPLPELLPDIRILLSSGLSNSPEVVDEVADRVAVVLNQARIPGIPRPEEGDWDFGEAIG
jgi:hypothetical protein